MTSVEWRELGFRPYARAWQGSRVVELMSYPFEDRGAWWVLIREPGDPATLRSAPLPPGAADYGGHGGCEAKAASQECRGAPTQARGRQSR